MALEIEAKFIHINPNDIRSRARELWFEMIHPEFLMKRATFMFSDINISLRVRQEYERVTMTYKDVHDHSIATGTTEHEVVVSDFDTTLDILKLTAKHDYINYQESKRELWRKGDIEIVLDTWPGTSTYIEIEALTEDILKVVAWDMWLDYSQAIFGRVGRVYEALWIMTTPELNTIRELTFEKYPSI